MVLVEIAGQPRPGALAPRRRGGDRAAIVTGRSLYSGAFRLLPAVPGTFTPSPMPAIAIRAFSATTALGRGLAAQA